MKVRHAIAFVGSHGIAGLMASLLGISASSAATCPQQQSVADGFQDNLLSAANALMGADTLFLAGMESGDLDEDGRVDLVTWDQDRQSLLLFFNAGEGSFVPAVPVPMPFSILMFARPRVADFDSDGHLDLLSFVPPVSAALVRLGRGDGSFDEILLSGGSPTTAGTEFDLGDLDGDGDLDIAQSSGFFNDGEILLLRGLGDGRFEPAQTIAPARGPRQIVARDLDADGLADIVFVDVEFNLPVPESVIVMRSLGGGAFAPGVAYAGGAFLSGALAVADMNGDGVPDLLKITAPGEVRLLPGVGDATFKAGGLVTIPDLDELELDVGDMDRDGMPDLIGRSADSQRVLVQRMTRYGPVGAPATIALGGNIFATRVTDLNADGLLDVATTTNGAFVLWNQLGAFTDIGYGQSVPIGTPKLLFSGTTAAGGVLSIGVSGVPVLVSGLLFFGIKPEYTAFKGGVLVPSPDVMFGVVTGVGLVLGWPAGIPAGTAVYAQAVLTSGAGLAAPLPSNAVVILAE